MPKSRKFKYKALVNITYGCNNFCTYCVVPYVRGREKSRTPKEIINEVKCLANDGCKEITLLGQNVNSYGSNLENPFTFAELLYELNKIDGIERIRFMTSHPKDLTDDLIKAIKECNKVCNHVHLPIQAGSDDVLRRMNRKYTKDHYLNLVEKLKNEIPDIALTTDIIVGFPGETEEDFEDTLSLVKEVEYDSAFTFLYSRRGGTPADLMFDQVDEKVKKDRFNRLVEVVNEISAKKNKLYDGKIVEILVEGESKSDDTKLTGRTRTSKLVNFTGIKENIGKLVNVRITKANSFSLIGEEV